MCCKIPEDFYYRLYNVGMDERRELGSGHPDRRPTRLPRLALALWRPGLVGTLAHLLSAARFLVQGDSMEPTLSAGQYFLVTRLAYLLDPPARGDIVVLSDPWGGGKNYIKRVVGLPGERVHLAGEGLVVNGQAVAEPYLVDATDSRGEEEWCLDTEEYLALGDNRRDSQDSRALGPVMRERILGKVWVCYWPRERWGKVWHRR